MELPKTWSELAIWVGMQFPVSAAVVGVAWWVLRWSNRQRLEELKRITEHSDRLLAEKESRLAELRTEKDQRISELKNELRELKEKHSRSRRPKEDTAGPADAGEGGS